MINGHGDDIYNYEGKIVSNFSSNIFSKRNKGLESHLQSKITAIYNYPSPDASQLKKIIARHERIKEDSIVITSGAVEAIYLIASSFGYYTAIQSPTFSEYEDASIRINKPICHFQDIDNIPEGTDIIWICNPNNPDGKVVPVDRLEDLITRNSNQMFVIDQAYEDYTMEPLFPARAVEKHDNLIIIKSLTKKFSLPGLRIGYIIAPPFLCKRLKKRLMPWAINALAIEAATYCYSNLEDFHVDISTLLKENERVCQELNKLGISCSESQTNFSLCCLPKGSASGLKQFLIDNYGILIRDASNFHGLDKRYFRVAVQTPEENNKLIAGIDRWITHQSK